MKIKCQLGDARKCRRTLAGRYSNIDDAHGLPDLLALSDGTGAVTLIEKTEAYERKDLSKNNIYNI
jgi:hypothetical protein